MILPFGGGCRPVLRGSAGRHAEPSFTMRRQIWNGLARGVPIGLAILLAAPSLSRAQQPPSAESRRFKPDELVSYQPTDAAWVAGA